MKLIITGATGQVGSSVLEQCLSHPEVTSVVALSRKEPAISHDKLEWLSHNDFTIYPPSVLSRLRGATTCIYCLGTNVPLKSSEENRTVNLEYAVKTAWTFSENFASNDTSNPFRFIYLSGALPEKDPSRTLWFLPNTRKMRGELENELLALSKAKAETGFAVHIVRPGFVQADNSTMVCAAVNLLANGIKQHYLSKAMTQIAVAGNENTVVENKDLIRIGKEQ